MAYNQKNNNHMKKDQSKGRMLDVAVLASECLFGQSCLHWGYWDDPVAAMDNLSIENYHAGQKRFMEKIIEAIPDGVKTVLDVGSGSGEMARMLQAAGYEVECVCPSPLQNEFNASKTKPGTVIHEGYFEALDYGKTYDCVLFCESFQYIRLEQAFPKLKELTDHVVICDYYKKSPDAKQGGGFSYPLFNEEYPKAGFEETYHEDITEGCTPNYAFKRKFYNELVIPGLEIVSNRVRQDYPFLSWMFMPTLKKKVFKLDKYRRKAERANPENLTKWVEYGIWVLKKG